MRHWKMGLSLLSVAILVSVMISFWDQFDASRAIAEQELFENDVIRRQLGSIVEHSLYKRIYFAGDAEQPRYSEYRYVAQGSQATAYVTIKIFGDLQEQSKKLNIIVKVEPEK